MCIYIRVSVSLYIGASVCVYQGQYIGSTPAYFRYRGIDNFQIGGGGGGGGTDIALIQNLEVSHYYIYSDYIFNLVILICQGIAY